MANCFPGRWGANAGPKSVLARAGCSGGDGDSKRQVQLRVLGGPTLSLLTSRDGNTEGYIPQEAEEGAVMHHVCLSWRLPFRCVAVQHRRTADRGLAPS